MKMINQYTNITKYYDLWITSGYYDFDYLANEALSIIGNGREVLELGVGTGLLAEKYIEIDPKCKFTGVDFTPSMLEIAKKRLGNKAISIEANVVTMNLNRNFDAAISNGGVWGILDLGDRWEFGGHVPNIEPNRQGLINLARHLRPGGLLLLHLQKPHEDFEKALPGEIVYSQFIEEEEDTSQYHTFKKHYFFKKDGKILAQQQLLFTCFKPEISQKMLSEAGFYLQGTSNGNSFAVYQKQ